MRILVLGAGFGGLEITTRLSEEFGDSLELTLIDKSEGFVFGFSKLDVMFGKATAEHVTHRYADLVKPGVNFVNSTITSIDPESKTVVTDAGTFTGDIMVVALGADLAPEATPGLVEHGNEFYTNDAAFKMREVIENFKGGHVVVGVTSTPLKCPPAPSETALLIHDHLVKKGLRDISDISLVIPLPKPIPPSPKASAALLDAFAEREIAWYPGVLVRQVDGDRKVCVLSDGRELPYDLFLAIPTHRVPKAVAESGMCVDGWIPVNPANLETSFPDVYAVGDVTSVGTPKAGVFSEKQGIIVAKAIAAKLRGDTSEETYDGRGICYVEFGENEVARVDVTFLPGQAPFGDFDDPSIDYVADKSAFGTERIARWFGRDWAELSESGN